MIRSRIQQDIANLCDLYMPLTDYDKRVLDRVYGLGMGPLEPQAKTRQPYDSLYVKLKRQADF